MEPDNPTSKHTNQQRQEAIWAFRNLARFQPVKAQMETIGEFQLVKAQMETIAAKGSSNQQNLPLKVYLVALNVPFCLHD
jgi:hypothetical protein